MVAIVSVRIIGQEPGAQSALYDSVTGLAFGPVFESAWEAEEFLTHWYTTGPDLRTLSVHEVDELVAQYRKERDEDDARL